MNARGIVNRVRSCVARVFNIGTARIDAVIDKSERAAAETRQRLTAAGFDQHTISTEDNIADLLPPMPGCG